MQNMWKAWCQVESSVDAYSFRLRGSASLTILKAYFFADTLSKFDVSNCSPH